MPPAARPGRAALIEWLLLVAALVLFAVLHDFGRRESGDRGPVPDPTGNTAHASPVGYLNIFLYDLALQADRHEHPPTSVIVAIDDDSIAQIGRWPWPRTVVAAMIDRLVAAGPGLTPAAIAIDVLLAEPSEQPVADVALAEAIAGATQRGIRVVLAVGKEPWLESGFLPIYPQHAFAQEAVLAHVAFVTGADGLVRGLHLREGYLPALAEALIDPAALPNMAAADRMIGAGRWDTSGGHLLRSCVVGGIERVSAAALLRGEVAAQSFADRLVLIGATAVGVGDVYATPLIGGRLRASGVELHAAAAVALAHGHVVRTLSPHWHALATALLVLATMALLYRTRPLPGLGIAILAIAGAIAATLIAFRFGWWIQPGGALVAIALGYPLWSWRRLTAASAGLFVQARTLELQDAVFGSSRRQIEPREPISAQLSRIENAVAQVGRLNRFLMDSLQSLPHPVLLADRGQKILLWNHRLAAAFTAPRPGASMSEWLHLEFGALPDRFELDPIRLDGEHGDRSGRHWLIDVSPAGDDQDDGRWLVQLVDISPLRAAERERQEALSFLSHDLRAPQATILAMIERAHSDGTRGLGIDLSELERQSRRTLALTDSFLGYARAGAKPLALEPYDLVALATEVVDLAWFAARQRSVRLEVAGPEAAEVACDAELLRRALANLVDNAIRYCCQGGQVTVTVAEEPGYWQIAVADQGPGIPAELRERIFEAFWQQSERNGAAGLGLAMVRKTVERHHGTITASDRPDGPGAMFLIRLPRTTAI